MVVQGFSIIYVSNTDDFTEEESQAICNPFLDSFSFPGTSSSMSVLKFQFKDMVENILQHNLQNQDI